MPDPDLFDSGGAAHWWDAPELDGVLWRGGEQSWGKRSREKAREAFREMYPLPGRYANSVKERAVWRAVKKAERRISLTRENGSRRNGEAAPWW